MCGPAHRDCSLLWLSFLRYESLYAYCIRKRWTSTLLPLWTSKLTLSGLRSATPVSAAPQQRLFCVSVYVCTLINKSRRLNSRPPGTGQGTGTSTGDEWKTAPGRGNEISLQVIYRPTTSDRVSMLTMLSEHSAQIQTHCLTHTHTHSKHGILHQRARANYVHVIFILSDY